MHEKAEESQGCCKVAPFLLLKKEKRGRNKGYRKKKDESKKKYSQRKETERP